ncbi:MAG: efflux RND transporter permease subunit [Planctomycetota bacterium]
MARRFYSKRIPFFNNVAMLLLCIIFFLLPFALRGARFAITEMQNNVADWLPSDFQETVDLVEFRRYFMGDQFVVISGPWCKEDNPAYTNLRRKIEAESLEYESVLESRNDQERLRAARVGDKFGLLYAGNFHEEWGQYRERWLKGNSGKWFYINRNGELYEWLGQNNVVEGGKRFLERLLNGRNIAKGRLVDTFGPPPDDSSGKPNPYYDNPLLLCGRPFKQVTTGPEAFEQMAGNGGTLRIGNFSEQDAITLEAKIEAHKRLSGALFGPTPPADFSWTYDSLLQKLDEGALKNQLLSGDLYRTKFEKFIELQVADRFQGDRARLDSMNSDERLELWYRMWDALELQPPARQTCMVVTINEPFVGELDRIVGRPILGKPRGRLLELATGECGLAKENVHLGGPPVDNVAIDEEGSSSLLKLASLSGLVGILLSYYAFRSVRVTFMLFFVGTMSAISSLAYVWFGGSRLDAILLTMPSLVYVLAMAGSVHMVHYYKNAVHQNGRKRAVETAIRFGWFPCFLVAFTDSLGLISLCTSNLKPIYNFGLYSAIATMGTLFFIYTFLPSALTIWPPPYHREPRKGEGDEPKELTFSDRFWGRVCDICTTHYWPVVIAATVLLVISVFGIYQIKTTVQLLKLFDKNAKILDDYRWMESNVGKLVPMEVVLSVDTASQREQWLEQQRAAQIERLKQAGQPFDLENLELEFDKLENNLKYTFLERLELSQRVRKHVAQFFGPSGLDIVGAGMSPAVFVPMQMVTSQIETSSNLDQRKIFNNQLLENRGKMVGEDYLAIANRAAAEDGESSYYTADSSYDGRELWRVSLRLAGLNDVDYGKFVNNIRGVVEPILRAYEMRTKILREIQVAAGEQSLTESRVLLLGPSPDATLQKLDEARRNGTALKSLDVDQTYLFADTLQDLLENRGYEPKKGKKRYDWIDPTMFNAERPFPDEAKWKELFGKHDCVILISPEPRLPPDFIQQNAKLFVDCTRHDFPTVETSSGDPGAPTAMQRKVEAKEPDLDVAAIYTGIVPIVYKAQGALLKSLIESTAGSFVSIAMIMMVLLRDWKGRWNIGNWMNFRGGMVAMLPNVFPIMLVFGAMGFLGIAVDIGSMMTASVAMGIAVDDTIHFLNWYNRGLQQGMTRNEAIRFSYTSCAESMAQTGLIVGCGLFVFALSTFQPTQRFGVLMLVLLNAATLGDLFVLPALLASPLGKWVGKERPRPEGAVLAHEGIQMELDEPEVQVISHPALKQVGDTKADSPTTEEPRSKDRKRKR